MVYNLKEIFFKYLEPQKIESISEWSNKNIVLGSRQPSNFRGLYRDSLTPYVSGIWDCLQDSSIDKITIVKGSQVGLTLASWIWILYLICNDPGNILFVYPSISLAQNASDTRFIPLIQDSEIVKRELIEGKHKLKKLSYEFHKCNLKWTGSNSEANLSSVPIRYLLMDEVSSFPINKGGISPVELAIERTKTFQHNRKILMLSTPKNETDYIWLNYLQGDQRKFFVPCPACGTEQFFTFNQIKFNDKFEIQDASASAYYECCNDSCKHHISDNEKIEMVKKGKWKATAKSISDKSASFHLPSFYAPWVKWGDVVTLFLKSKGFENELKNVINSTFAEPWKEKKIYLSEQTLNKNITSIAKGVRLETSNEIIPDKNPNIQISFKQKYSGMDSKIVLTSDVQQTENYYVVRQWFNNGDSFLLEWGTKFTFQEINDVANYYKADGVFIDEGYNKIDVMQACIDYSFVPCIGRDNVKSDKHYKQDLINAFEGTDRQKENLMVSAIIHKPSNLKNTLVNIIEGKTPYRWYLYKGIEHEYMKQLQAEEKINGKWIPKKGFPDNHILDCEVLQLIGGMIATYIPN